MKEDYILLILNCEKYKHKSKVQKKLWVDNLKGIKYFYIRGDETICTDFKFDKDTLYVKCKDNYTSLPTKIITALDAVKKTFEYKYVFKTDDDQMLVNKNFFSDLIKDLEEEKYDYGGFVVDIKKHYTNYKYDNVDKKVLLNDCSYVNGRFYFLSPRCVDYLLTKKNLFYDYIYEDYAIGYELRNFDKKVKRYDTQFDNFLDVPIYVNNKYHIFTICLSDKDSCISMIKNFINLYTDICINIYLTIEDVEYFKNNLEEKYIENVEYNIINSNIKNVERNYANMMIWQNVINSCKSMDRNILYIDSSYKEVINLYDIICDIENNYDAVNTSDKVLCLNSKFIGDNFNKEDLESSILNNMRDNGAKIINYL